jgi:hypothetical protein
LKQQLANDGLLLPTLSFRFLELFPECFVQLEQKKVLDKKQISTLRNSHAILYNNNLYNNG